MTPTTPTQEPITAAEEERSSLAKVHQEILHNHFRPPGQAALISPSGERIPLPLSLFRVLQKAVEVLQQGEGVAVVPIHKELTTQQAADILNVSRQYLVRLLEQGEIPFTKAGTHRRIKYGDLMAYKQRRDAERREGLDQLTQMSQDLGLYA